VKLAVVAHIRHVETDYDEMLAGGVDRGEARDKVSGAVERTLRSWSEQKDA
jgi:hypothetical protein